MGRRIIKILTVLFLWSLSSSGLMAQIETGTFSTSCTFEVSYTIHHPTCPEEADGSIDLVVANATGIACYYWMEGATGNEPNLNQLSAGVYKASIGDEALCFDTLTFSLNDPTPLAFEVDGIKSCPGSNNGKITVNPISGNADAYALDGGASQVDPVFPNLEPGMHTVRVFDAAGCYYDEEIEITEAETPIVTFAQEESSCSNAGDASFIVIIETVNNTETYEYSIDGENYLPDSTFTDLEVGNYEVFIRNSNLCVFTEQIDISAVEAPEVSFDKSDVTCPGGADASFIVIIETVNNSEDYEYSTDGINYQSNPVFENLESDFYQVFVKNSSDCIYEETVFVEEPETPTINFDVNEVTCPDGSDASFIVIIETVNNSEGYEYSIDGDYFQYDSTFTDLEAGVYEVVSRNPQGCEFIQLVEIEEPVVPIIDFEKTDVSCPGGTDASFIVIIETVNNSENYQYSIDGDNYQEDSTFNDLPAGFYEVYAKNNSDCIHSQIVEIVEPVEPNIDFEISDVTCPDGNDASFIVIIETVNNSESYEYSLDGENFQDDSTFVDLEAGAYQVYARNTAGCEFTDIMEVDEPEMPEIDFEISDVTCPDGNDASFIVIIETVNNSGNFVFSLNGNEYQEDSTFTQLSAGIHNVTIKNEASCLFTEVIEIQEPSEPELGFEIDDVTCAGGSDASFIVIIETVNNSDYEYSIGDGIFQEDSLFVDLDAGIYDISVRNADGCVSSESIVIEEPLTPSIDFGTNDVTCAGGTDASLIVIIETVNNSDSYEYSLDDIEYQMDSTFYNLAAGVYTAYIRNQDNCVYSELVSVSEPLETDVSLINTDVSCPGTDDGSISVAAQGEGSVFEYSLDGINFQTSNTFENLEAGVYVVTVRNEATCEVSENTLITAPPPPQYETNINPVSCNNGTDGNIEINILSGITPFEFALNGGAFQSDNLFENLSAGTYTLNMIDDSGCIFTSVANLNEPPPINAIISNQNETCDHANGWIAVAVEGGTSPYNYEWQNEETTPSVSELSEGVYRVSVTDGNNCLLVDSILIENEPAPDIEAELQSLNCFDAEDAWISLNVQSLAPPFNFVWSNGDDTEQVSDLSAGEYSVTVTDQNNCLTSAEFTIEEPEELQVLGEVVAFETTARVDLQVEGGEAPYSYEWSNGKNTKDLSEVPFGYYSVLVTDANGCEINADFRVQDPSLPFDGAINVYPTLTSNEVNIDIQLPEALPVNICLIDELGRIVQIIDPSTIENQVVTMDLENLSAAMYYIRIDIGEEQIVKKVVKVIE